MDCSSVWPMLGWGRVRQKGETGWQISENSTRGERGGGGVVAAAVEETWTKQEGATTIAGRGEGGAGLEGRGFPPPLPTNARISPHSKDKVGKESLGVAGFISGRSRSGGKRRELSASLAPVPFCCLVGRLGWGEIRRMRPGPPCGTCPRPLGR